MAAKGVIRSNRQVIPYVMTQRHTAFDIDLDFARLLFQIEGGLASVGRNKCIGGVPVTVRISTVGVSAVHIDAWS